MSKIILNSIVNNSKNYGIFYYDVEKDQLFFKNKDNKIIPLTDKKVVHVRDNKVLHQGIWNSNIFYELNELVQFDNKLYICINSHTSNDDNDPKSNTLDWLLICQVNYNGDNNNNFLYLSCFNNNKTINITKNFNLSLPVYNVMDISGNNIYVENDNKILINQSGLYKITYNIGYYGSVVTIIGQVGLLNVDNNRGEIVKHSCCSSYNYYHDNNNDQIVNLQHSFFVNIRTDKYDDQICRLILTVSSQDINKTFNYDCTKTWIYIKKKG